MGNIHRLKSLLPKRGDVEKITAALQATGSDPNDLKMLSGPVALHLGGEEGKGERYSRIRRYTLLVQLGLLFEYDHPTTGQKRLMTEMSPASD